MATKFDVSEPYGDQFLLKQNGNRAIILQTINVNGRPTLELREFYEKIKMDEFGVKNIVRYRDSNGICFNVKDAKEFLKVIKKVLAVNGKKFVEKFNVGEYSTVTYNGIAKNVEIEKNYSNSEYETKTAKFDIEIIKLTDKVIGNCINELEKAAGGKPDESNEFFEDCVNVQKLCEAKTPKIKSDKAKRGIACNAARKNLKKTFDETGMMDDEKNSKHGKFFGKKPIKFSLARMDETKVENNYDSWADNNDGFGSDVALMDNTEI